MRASKTYCARSGGVKTRLKRSFTLCKLRVLSGPSMGLPPTGLTCKIVPYDFVVKFCLASASLVTLLEAPI